MKKQSTVWKGAADLRSWLSGDGRLALSNVPNYHYRVKRAYMSETAVVNKVGGRMTAVFICDPFLYYDSGENEVVPGATISNPGLLAYPVYRLHREMIDFDLTTITLTVNGNALTVSVYDEITIDTENNIIYDDDGNVINKWTAGDIDGLLLDPGSNSISISSGTFSINVTPNWRRF